MPSLEVEGNNDNDRYHLGSITRGQRAVTRLLQSALTIGPRSRMSWFPWPKHLDSPSIFSGRKSMKHDVILGCCLALSAATALADDRQDRDSDHRNGQTATPIKHLVVIFQENVSYDHYFGTYPTAQNNPGETPFKAKKHTPRNNNLLTPLDVNNGFTALGGVDLILSNPNNNPNNPQAPNNSRKNGGGASNPFRLSPAQAVTSDQGHNYTPEQEAYNNGQMDGFPAWTGVAGPPPSPPPATVTTTGLVM